MFPPNGRELVWALIGAILYHLFMAYRAKKSG